MAGATNEAVGAARGVESGPAAWDLLITLTAAPFASDVVTTVFRLLNATLRRGARTQVWACGYATALTQRSLGDLKPANVLEPGAAFPSTASIISGLLKGYPETLRWQVCRFCAEDRGALDHVDGVPVRSFSRFAGRVAESATTVYIGGA